MYEEELELAKKAALAAGNFLRRRDAIRINCQEERDIKLSSDQYSEKVILDVLQESAYPVLSEECGSTGKPDEALNRRWIIDPLDGTLNYFRGLDDLACVSIALWECGDPVLGVVYRFMREELYWGVTGNGAFLNGERIGTASTAQVRRAVLATGFPVKRSYDTGALESFIARVQHFKKIRMLGAAAVMGVFVACGKLDSYIEEEIMIWDVAAAAAIVKAAGGCVDIRLLHDNKCVCSFFSTEKLREDFHAQGL